MTDELLSYEEALETARELFDDLIERDPDGARSMLRLPAYAPIVVADDLLRRAAWIGMLNRAVTVRCTRDCGHRQRYAMLAFGVLACRECIGSEYPDIEARRGDDCDVCGAHAHPFAKVEHQIGDLFVLARTCDACGRLWESLKLPPVQMSMN